VVAESEARQTAAELVNVREASAAVEAAVESAEQSLKRLRESAAKLRAVVISREAAAKRAAERAAELRAKADAAGTIAVTGPADLRAEQQRIQRQLVEKRSLLESAAAVTVRIARAAEQTPRDGGLAASAKLAAELRSRLAREVEETAEELRRVDESLSEFDPSASAPAGK
jgi:hypothetical protein